METIITIISFIAILALLVIIHEFGHYYAAKKSGVLVEEFGFGFPPRIWGKKIGETLYSINALPIGGFVKVYGEEYYEEDHHVDPKLKDRAFVNKKHWQKVLIIVAGVFMNFMLGWVIISFLFTQGVPVPSDKVLVEQVQQNSPAAKAGLKAQDQIIELRADGQAIKLNQSQDLINLTQKYGDREVTLTILRNNKPTQVKLTPRKNPPKGEGSMGVVLNSFSIKKYTWYEAPFYGLKEAANMTKMIATELLKTLGRFITFQKTNVEVAGPIGIAQFTGKAISYGPTAVLELIALLSLNLAVINILPFPALDGGRLVFILYEWVTGKRVNKNFERYMNLGGMILLLSLSALITINDIVKLWR